MSGGPSATRRAILAALVAAGWRGGGAHAMDTERRTLRMIVPQAAGGASDFMARLLAKDLSRALGRPVVVDNRPGGGNIVGTHAVAVAPPDGNTFGMVLSSHAINQAMRPRTPYNALADFEPLCLGGHSIVVLVASPRFVARTLAEAIERMRRADPPLHYASLGVGSVSHLAGELLAIEADVTLQHVAYNGSAEVYRSLARGDLPLAFVTLESALPHLRSRQIRALGITSAQRAAPFPELPAIAEVLPGFELDGFFGFVAPAGTPAAFVERLGAEIGRSLQSPAIRDRLLHGGLIVSIARGAAFREFLQRQVEKYTALARRTGITLD